MKQILILTSIYLPTPGANGLITELLVNELKKRNYSIEIISIKSHDQEVDFENINDINIYRIPKTNFAEILETQKNKGFKLFAILLRRFKNLIKIKDFPNFDEIQTVSIMNKAKDIIESEGIEWVIGIGKPFSNIEAMVKLTNNYKKIKFCGIFLDPLFSISKPKLLPKKLFNRMLDIANERYIKNIDVILQPANAEEFYDEKKYGKFFTYFEYPSLDRIRFNNLSNSKDKTEIKLTYAGSLDKVNRNPNVLLKTISELNNLGINLKLNLYGKNELDEKYVYNDAVIIKNHGYAEIELIIDAYQKSDFLINISNSTIKSIPSKIFELFSTGKPIINFLKDESDYSLRYFQKYPLCFNFFENKNFENQIIQLERFIHTNKDKTLSQKLVRNIYYKNTAEYFINQLEEKLT